MARAQFIEFFKWYYAHCPDKDISPILIAEYSKQTRTSFFVPDIVLPIFTRDCQRLVQVLDFAIENQLYLESGQLDDYRNEVVVHLGPDYDPARLYLIRDQRELIRLIREVQNHITPTQFERYLRSLPQDLLLTAPCGKSQPIHLALKHWLPLPYGMYHLKDETYRVVPHRRLRLETLDEWPSGRVILLWGRMLGYKKQTPFQVSIGRRAIDAIPYVRSHSKKTYIWAGEAPLGQKFAIDGQLRGESAGADWQVTLRLIGIEREEPGLCIAVTRLMLYYPETPHQRICISSSAGYKYEDTLREDGVRRFHLHRELAIPLNNFDAAIDIGVTVGDNVVLQKTFTPEPVYLFSVSNHELVGARSVADFGDRKYILFVRDSSIPIAGEGVTIQRLRKPFGAFTLYQVTWEDPKHHFSLRVGAYHWAFLQRREFAILFTPPQPPDHLRLKPNQILSFETLSLRLYSTANLTTMDLKLELYDDDSLLCQIDLTLHINPESTEYFFEVNSEIWKELQSQANPLWTLSDTLP